MVGRTPRLATPCSGPLTQPENLDHEDAGQRRPVVLHLQVRGRKTQLLPEPLAPDHPPADAVGSPQQLGRAVQVAAGESFAHRSAGDPDPIEDNGLHLHHFDTLVR